jgi:hypothetical protein
VEVVFHQLEQAVYEVGYIAEARVCVPSPYMVTADAESLADDVADDPASMTDMLGP